MGGVWLDYDGDSRLDLFVVNYMKWDPATERACPDYCHPRFYDPTPNRLYRNNGDGTFADVSDAAGIRDHLGKGMGAGVADFDGNGLLDIFVANDKTYNFLFLHRDGGRFEEAAFEAGVVLPGHGGFVSGMGVDSRDFDNDGLPDIAYVALPEETFPLFRNLGEGVFEEVTLQAGLAHTSRAMAGYSPGIVDFDNDGWKDLFVSRGHVQARSKGGVGRIEQHNSVFRNAGNGQVTALTAEAGLTAATPKRHRGAAFGDFNHDGRMDVVVSALRDEAEIWMNESPGGHHWLQVRLVGTASNRDGVGAELKLATRSGVQFNHFATAVGYASSSAGPVHFGLGPDQVAERLEIRWPSGRVQVMEGIAADRLLEVVEPGG